METGRLHVLIAEDDPDDIVIITDLLQTALKRGLKVCDVVSNPAELLMKLAAGKYDVCLLDYRMGEVDGLSILREMREKNYKTPVVFLTGQGDQEIAVEAMKAGAMDYLDKAKLSAEVLAHSITYAIGLSRKEEERRRTQEALQRMTRQFELILTAAGDGIFGVGADGKIVFVNPAATRLLGYEGDELVGKDAFEILCMSRSSGELVDRASCPITHVIDSGIVSQGGDESFRKKDGAYFHAEYTVAPIMDVGRVTGAVAIFKDVTERKNIEKMIKSMAYHDALTGLPNRILFYDRLNVALTHAQRYKQMVAILFVDLDDFKPVNDTYGHAVGDLLLQELARRLRSCLREGDTVARFGGDEFVILLPQIAKADDAAITAQKIFESIKAPFHLGKHSMDVRASLGIALYPADGQDVDTLLQRADEALYKAKGARKNNFQFYTADAPAR